MLSNEYVQELALDICLLEFVQISGLSNSSFSAPIPKKKITLVEIVLSLNLSSKIYTIFILIKPFEANI